MPVEFALGGLIVIAAAIVTLQVARLHVGGGWFLLGLAVLLFVAVLVMNVLMLTVADRKSHRETVLILQAVVAGVGWFALLGALAGIRREGGEP